MSLGFLYNYKILNYRVIDGDTVFTSLDLGFDASVNLTCRLYGIDTPELYGTTSGNLIKKIVANWLAGRKELYVKSVEKDKYAGRYVGTIFDSNFSSLNTYLFIFGLAKEYFGKTKKWTDEELLIAEDNANIILSDLASDNERQLRLSQLNKFIDDNSIIDWIVKPNKTLGGTPLSLLIKNDFGPIDKMIELLKTGIS
jgi:hypothetical protein